MASVENSTNKSETYSGLNLGALQSLDSGEFAIAAESEPAETLTVTQADGTRPGSSQGEQGLGVAAQGDAANQNENTQSVSTLLPPPSEVSMQDYYRLQQNLLGLTVVFGAVIFPFVWGFYSLQVALDYVCWVPALELFTSEC